MSCTKHCVQEQAEALISSFEAPLKEFVRLVKSAKAVMADRSSALQAAHQVPRSTLRANSWVFFCIAASAAGNGHWK